MKKTILTALFITGISITGAISQTIHTNQLKNNNMDNLKITSEWDKVFPKSDKVNHRKVTFRNRYGITLVADMYVPENTTGKLAAIAVSGPFGAVKEQSSG